jgi:hypothetical protein
VCSSSGFDDRRTHPNCTLVAIRTRGDQDREALRRRERATRKSVNPTSPRLVPTIAPGPVSTPVFASDAADRPATMSVCESTAVVGDPLAAVTVKV